MILSLRDPELAARDKALLACYGLDCMPCPVAMAEAVAFDQSPLEQAEGFMITSLQAASYLPSQNKDRPVYVTGRRSAAAVKAQGYHNIIIGHGDGHALAEMMRPKVNKRILCWLRGQSISFDMKDALDDIAHIDEAICYKMKRVEHLDNQVIKAVTKGHIKAVMALSAGQLSYFEALLQQSDLWHSRKQIELLAISPAVADKAKQSGWRLVYQARRKRAVSVRALAVCRDKQRGL